MGRSSNQRPGEAGADRGAGPVTSGSRRAGMFSSTGQGRLGKVLGAGARDVCAGCGQRGTAAPTDVLPLYSRWYLDRLVRNRNEWP